MRIVAWALAASGGLLLLAGCGLSANPQPPTAWLPQPVRDLSASRSGEEVHLHWTMPRNSTDKLALKGNQRAHICWLPGASPFSLKACQTAGDAAFAPDRPTDFSFRLPPAQLSGPPRVLSVFVELQNHAGKTAGPSNPALIATGAPPSPLRDLRLDTSAAGIVLHWQPASSEPGLVLRIHRLLVRQPNAPTPSAANGAPPPEHQVLEVDLAHSDPGQALDRDASLDHIWRYTAERVLRVVPDSRPHDVAGLDVAGLDVAGLSDGPVTIDAKDTFPPQVPAGLAAVPDTQAHAVGLSWAPDPDPDLAGYIVYRRDLASASAPERISGKSPIVPPSFSDTAAAPGHRYAWSVSAIDRDGNESARSSEIEEELPQ